LDLRFYFGHLSLICLPANANGSAFILSAFHYRRYQRDWLAL